MYGDAPVSFAPSAASDRRASIPSGSADLRPDRSSRAGAAAEWHSRRKASAPSPSRAPSTRIRTSSPLVDEAIRYVIARPPGRRSSLYCTAHAGRLASNGHSFKSLMKSHLHSRILDRRVHLSRARGISLPLIAIPGARTCPLGYTRSFHRSQPGSRECKVHRLSPSRRYPMLSWS